MPAAPCHRKRRDGRGGSKTRSAPPPRREAGRSILPAPGPGCGDLPPQRTTSREMCLILPIPPHTDDRPRTAAESITAVRTAEPAHQGRRDNPADLQPPRMHRTRLRRDPERHGRGGGHGRRMRHPEGGRESDGHRWFPGCVGRWFVRRCGRSPAAGIRQNEKREARPIAPLPRRFRLADRPRRARCCGDGMGRDSRFVRQW
jgi:hypothetical protein